MNRTSYIGSEIDTISFVFVNVGKYFDEISDEASWPIRPQRKVQVQSFDILLMAFITIAERAKAGDNSHCNHVIIIISKG